MARQTGKTFTWASTAIETCLQKKGARVRYATAYQDDLKEFLKPVIDTICQDCPSYLRPKWYVQGSKYIFPTTGSELKLVGLDINPDGIRGNALDLVIIDEGGFVSKLSYVYSIIVAMLRHRPHLRVILSSSSPETPDHDFWGFVDKAQIEGALFKATIDDDETCTQARKDMIAQESGGYDSTTYRRELMCERIVDSELAIIPEWQEGYATDLARDSYFPHYHRYVAMDIGVVDYTAVLFGYYDFLKATLYIEDEICVKGPSLTTDRLAVLVKDREKSLWSDEKGEVFKVYRRIADNNNLLLLNDLSALHNCYFRATNKDELPAMVNETRLLVKQGRLKVHPRCRYLIGCLKTGIYNEKKIKREFARSKEFGHYDALAALIYLVRNLDTNTNPIPDDLGLSKFTHQMPHHKPVPKEKAFAVKLTNQSFLRRDHHANYK